MLYFGITNGLQKRFVEGNHVQFQISQYSYKNEQINEPYKNKLAKEGVIK